jgi:peptidoglycan pentaglycine glycine transferase (the first glycine)
MTSAATVNAQQTDIETREVVDAEEWGRALEPLGGSVLQSWNWGEFKSRHGWDVVRLLATRGGEPCLAAQILIRKMGPFALLYVPRGPASGAFDHGVHILFTLAIDSLARSKRAAISFVEPEQRIFPGASLNGAGDLLWTSVDGELQPLRTIKVAVDRSDDEILAEMKSKTRYNVRLASRRGVTVRIGEPGEVVDFYEMLCETGERDEFGIHSVEYYADLLDVFGDDCVLLLAEREGELAAGAIVLRHGHEAIYLFGASSRTHQRDMPSHLVQFEAMRWARDRGCTRYDLWGIPAKDDPPADATSGEINIRSGLWGVYRFKQGFGGEIVTYPGVFERQYYPRLVGLWRRYRPGLGL